jgi:2-amino-4-hydroxy-6-hydroxymethyldihydropteridine diphosphokinase
MPRVHIGFGGNLGDVDANLRGALEAIAGLPATLVVRVSSLYRTAPVGLLEQPDFTNGVVEVETGLEPSELLRRLLEIEQSLGRTREVSGGPRTVDLDVLLWEDRIVETSVLQVPHPHMHERGFVLVPLNEIAPRAVHPTLGRTVRELLGELGPTPDVIPLGRPRWARAREEETRCSAES